MKRYKIGLGLLVLGHIACMTIFAAGMAGCQLLDRTFDQTMQRVRDLPPEAPTPGWEGMATNFLYTLLIGATGGAGLYGGVIRPRRIAREKQEPKREQDS